MGLLWHGCGHDDQTATSEMRSPDPSALWGVIRRDGVALRRARDLSGFPIGMYAVTAAEYHRLSRRSKTLGGRDGQGRQKRTVSL